MKYNVVIEIYSPIQS